MSDVMSEARAARNLISSIKSAIGHHLPSNGGRCPAHGTAVNGVHFTKAQLEIRISVRIKRGSCYHVLATHLVRGRPTTRSEVPNMLKFLDALAALAAVGTFVIAFLDSYEVRFKVRRRTRGADSRRCLRHRRK